MYNVHQYISKLEDLKDFNYPFARLDQVESQFDEPKEEEKEEGKLEEVAEEDEEEP